MINKTLIATVLVLAFHLYVDAQTPNVAILSGSVYDANGAVIVGAVVTATDEKGNKFRALTDGDGSYTLRLPFSPYHRNGSHRIAKYDITVRKDHFEPALVKNFGFVPADPGPAGRKKMTLDIALDVLASASPA